MIFTHSGFLTKKLFMDKTTKKTPESNLFPEITIIITLDGLSGSFYCFDEYGKFVKRIAVSNRVSWLFLRII